ncbi:MAG: PAS domain-containing protein [Gammaproteobacteria bacterium]|nr:PAS domain-containing protein [Gammaproteobacteria bacterium]NIR97766.1 PAS domain-containing protein [Gammaproteobacteria bacterium]NIT63476.1 PAS domain-containing protein [Gammaproteobacteria bacterium]NIV20414.1 PAS domain-containing protein [Gammaproteobacteria bacterium]NIX10988.1 PAS domain-containing protein [Gammaproteobacteria bacterium]
MTFDLSTLFAVGVSYLALLFLIAFAADKGWVPARVARHPATYVLSLGVYATSWSFYGSVGFAQTEGYNFLTVYLGVTLAFLLTPVLLMPILRLTREYQLLSVADLFAFRYRSQWVGVLVTAFMLTGTLPYIALQIRAVTESLRVLTQEVAPAELAFVFCLTLTLFAILFGARHISARERHQGMVVAIAFESLVKATALMAAGLFAVFGVFGGPSALNEWLAAHPEAVEHLYQPVREGPWTTLLLLSFAAAFLLPRQFHMAFTENLSRHSLSVASWAFPLFLLLINLVIPPILWAGSVQQPDMSADYYVLGITLASDSTLLPTLVFVGGLSAASAMMIVTTLALSAMCLNHLLLPASYPDPAVDLYRWLLWGRRMLIALIIMLGYSFYLLLEHNQGLVQLGLISFVAVAQFVPGVAGVLYWRGANRFGFIAGLLGGAAVWALTLLLPLLQTSGILSTNLDFSPWMARLGQDRWEFATFWSLTVNSLLFVGVSLVTRPSEAERQAAYACCRETLTPPPGVVGVSSPAEFRERLERIIGTEAASEQVDQALSDLGMDPEEHRPAELARLRERIERNLSGLLGPLLARMIVDERLGTDPQAETALASNVRFIEQHLEASNTRLRGLAAELDNLRRYHRQILQDLPLGVCSLGPNGEIVVWNLAMEILSSIERDRAVGLELSQLPGPWDKLLEDFLHTRDRHVRKQRVLIDGQPRWFNLHQSSVDDPVPSISGGAGRGGTVLLVEDLTDLHILEAELAHSERLASIGRLAAGVAHEIGNPVTGIACLVQNMRAEQDVELHERSLEQILQQTQRISNIVESLVGFSHSGTPVDYKAEPVALSECIDEAVHLVRLSRSGKQLTFVNDCPRELVVMADHQRLAQVFVNLLSNASDASRPGQRIDVRAETDRAGLHIDVVDQGEGIPEELRERVFEPFFTTKPPGEGTGLGLPMIYNIVQEHGGSVMLGESPGGGTRVRIDLPAAMIAESAEGERELGRAT